MKEPVLIKEVLKQTIKRLGIDKGLSENKAVACWKEVVGRDISTKSEATKIIKGVLYVKTESPVWSQQLSFMAEELVAKINNHLGGDVVKKIRFRS